MLFRPFLHPDTNEVNTFIVGCEETRQCVLIDAGADSGEYDAFLAEQNATLTGIFLTHIHWDHVDGLPELQSRFDVPVWSMTGEYPNSQSVDEGDSIPIGNLTTRIVRTTGHTPNSLTLIVNERIAFVGDAIFAGAIGGTTDDALKQEEIRLVREHVLSLPDDVLICSGHGPLTTVAIEKAGNPFFI